MGQELITDNKYTYDSNENQLEKLQKHGIIRYSYDNMNHLNKVQYPNATEKLFYDKAENRNYASDKMGSITHVVDSEAEKTLNHYEYDAWGNLITCEEKVLNRFKFNGQQFDLIMQPYYLRARYYNSVIGRFTQEDTYHGDGLNLQL